ncbi:MAG: hypothetical protein JWP81_1894 [Ferruginibacter sp.]|nr:hypothetical protein [Ferruginibacter sp.]
MYLLLFLLGRWIQAIGQPSTINHQQHMAKPTIELIAALRQTAERLRNGAYYAWGHHGACNCGNLVQVVTNFTKEEVLRYAHTGIGEWTEMAEEFCSATHAPVALVITRLQEIGLTPTDIHNIEYLSDKEVLQHLPGGFQWLKRNNKEHAILYFEAFANLLEEKLLRSIDISFESIPTPFINSFVQHNYPDAVIA